MNARARARAHTHTHTHTHMSIHNFLNFYLQSFKTKGKIEKKCFILM